MTKGLQGLERIARSGSATVRQWSGYEIVQGWIWESENRRGASNMAPPAMARRLVVKKFGEEPSPADQRLRKAWERIMVRPMTIWPAADRDIGQDLFPVRVSVVIRVLFEVGRHDLSLDQLRHLKAGAILPLTQRAATTVELVVSDKRIARGSLIKFADGIGVRVTRLFDYG